MSQHPVKGVEMFIEIMQQLWHFVIETKSGCFCNRHCGDQGESQK